MKLKQCCVLVTPTSFGAGNAGIKVLLEDQVGQVIYNNSGKPYGAKKLQEIIGNVDGYIAGLDEINSDVIRKAEKLKVIARYGTGMDNVDLKSAKEKGIIVTYTPGANASSVADLTVAFILMLCRSIYQIAEKTKKGEWPRVMGLSLENKTVGLYGFGAIGREVARKLTGFDCRIIAFDIVQNQEIAEKYCVEYVDRDTIIAESDFLSLHIPITKKNQKMVNSNFIEKMKDGSLLINTARGELVDEVALANAILNKKLTGAALDTFEKEPPDPNNPLLGLSQVITTPHMGAHAESAINQMSWMALEDCLAVLKGEKPKFPVSI